LVGPRCATRSTRRRTGVRTPSVKVDARYEKLLAAILKEYLTTAEEEMGRSRRDVRPGWTARPKEFFGGSEGR
jgi:ribosomal protein L34E